MTHRSYTITTAIILATYILIALPQLTIADNIAQGKQYTVSPKLSVQKSIDIHNVLTDGKTAPGKKLLWAGSTPDRLRWRVRGKKFPTITVDLGNIKPISGVALHAGGGASGGVFPSVIYIQTSEDGKTFHTVGDLVHLDKALAPPSYYNIEGKRRHWYKTHNLHTKGRYVRFIILPGLRWLSCDEIQVYQGKSSWLNEPIGGKVLSKKQLLKPLKLTRKGVQRRCRLDAAAVRTAIEKHAPDSTRNKLLSKLKPLIKQAKKPLGWPESLQDFKAILPVGNLDAKILGVYGQLLAAQGSQPLTLWHSPPYQQLPLLQNPGASIDYIKLRMMQNEYRSQVFNMTNASAKVRKVAFTIKGLPHSALDVFKVDYVDMAEGRPVATALTKLSAQDSTFTVNVPAGMTRQVFLRVHSKGLLPKVYRSVISLKSGNWSKILKFNVRVAPLRMTDRMALNTGDWDYVFGQHYSVTDKNKKELAHLLTGHGVNIVKITRSNVPIPSRKVFDNKGNLTEKIDYTNWDKAVDFWGKSQRFYVVGNFYFKASGGSARSDFAGFKLGTPACQNALSQWAQNWAAHNKKLALKPEQVLLLFIDEPRSQKQWNAVATLARGFKKGTNDIPIVEDFSAFNLKQFKQAHDMLQAVDIIQPTRSLYTRIGKAGQKEYQKLIDQGKQLWFYSCVGSTKQFSTTYYLMQPWHCFATGATGSGFWGYAHTHLINNWNPYLMISKGWGNKTDYSPLMISSTDASTTKHWEAMREGVEDYQYLTMLTKQGKKKLAHSIAVHVTKTLLKRYGRVYYSSWRSDYGLKLANQARLRALNILVSMQSHH